MYVASFIKSAIELRPGVIIEKNAELTRHKLNVKYIHTLVFPWRSVYTTT
jgi:hypothetical protein